MTAEEQNTCLAFLLAVALQSGLTIEQVQAAARKLLTKLDAGECALAAGTPIEF